jgi:hypothetical protein
LPWSQHIGRIHPGTLEFFLDPRCSTCWQSDDHIPVPPGTLLPQIDSEQLRANVFAFGGEDLRHEKVPVGRLREQVRKMIPLDSKVKQPHWASADRFHTSAI